MEEFDNKNSDTSILYTRDTLCRNISIVIMSIHLILRIIRVYVRSTKIDSRYGMWNGLEECGMIKQLGDINN